MRTPAIYGCVLSRLGTGAFDFRLITAGTLDHAVVCAAGVTGVMGCHFRAADIAFVGHGRASGLTARSASKNIHFCRFS